ncbi:MAG TPA: NAD-dependent epimerase/dehydratase family protein [Pyrinomonadaceae bacterium]|nr:NAD-dependent epimerase/dehydratase family protein [Pyrinomonadaceae bacterium]
MKVLITGSTGFIGGSLGRYGARAGHTVMGTGRSPEPSNEWPGLYQPNDTTAESLSEIVSNFDPDVLFHAAGTASVGASLVDPLADFRGSVEVSANMLEAVRRSGKNPLVFIPSSAAVYGNPAALPVDEETKIQPISPYGFHKAMCEVLARESAECFGLRIIVCRLFSVFGAGQRRLLIWDLFKQLSGPSEVAWLEGSGSESRDFLYIDDVAEAIIQLAEKFGDSPSGYFDIINVASGEETKVVNLAGQIRDLVAPGKDVRCRGTFRPGDPLNWRGEISKLRSMLPGWKPRPVISGLNDCATAWQQDSNALQHGA